MFMNLMKEFLNKPLSFKIAVIWLIIASVILLSIVPTFAFILFMGISIALAFIRIAIMLTEHE